jgi:hypothetical protein
MAQLHGLQGHNVAQKKLVLQQGKNCGIACDVQVGPTRHECLLSLHVGCIPIGSNQLKVLHALKK